MTPDSPIPKRLIDSFFDERGVVAFVGSALSMSEGLPNWKGLITKMREKAEDSLDAHEHVSVLKHIDAGDFIIVANYLKSKLSKSEYRDCIWESFSTSRKGKLHSLLKSIPFKGILTTNYDNILSQSPPFNIFNLPFTWEDTDIQHKIRSKFLLHVHGLFSTVKSIILTPADYDNLSLESDNWSFWETMKLIFFNRHVVFIGCRLSDPDFNFFITKLRQVSTWGIGDHHSLLIEGDEDYLDIYRIKEHLKLMPILINPISDNHPIGDWLNNLKNSIIERNPLPDISEHLEIKRLLLYSIQLNLLNLKL